jgi:hypothetical protein
MWFKNFIFCLLSFYFFHRWYLCYEKRRRWYLYPFFPSKTDEFPLQRHIAPLKLRHVAPYIFLFYFLYFNNFFKKKKKKNCRGGLATHKGIFIYLFIIIIINFTLALGGGRMTPMGHEVGSTTPKPNEGSRQGQSHSGAWGASPRLFPQIYPYKFLIFFLKKK